MPTKFITYHDAQRQNWPRPTCLDCYAPFKWKRGIDRCDSCRMDANRLQEGLPPWKY